MRRHTVRRRVADANRVSDRDDLSPHSKESQRRERRFTFAFRRLDLSHQTFGRLFARVDTVGDSDAFVTIARQLQTVMMI